MSIWSVWIAKSGGISRQGEPSILIYQFTTYTMHLTKKKGALSVNNEAHEHTWHSRFRQMQKQQPLVRVASAVMLSPNPSKNSQYSPQTDVTGHLNGLVSGHSVKSASLVCSIQGGRNTHCQRINAINYCPSQRDMRT